MTAYWKPRIRRAWVPETGTFVWHCTFVWHSNSAPRAPWTGNVDLFAARLERKALLWCLQQNRKALKS